MTIRMMFDMIEAEVHRVAELTTAADPPSADEQLLMMTGVGVWLSDMMLARKTGDLASTARQCDEIDRLCARMRTSATEVMQLCHDVEFREATLDARPVEYLRDAWARGARTPADLQIHEAFALWQVCERYVIVDADDAPDPAAQVPEPPHKTDDPDGPSPEPLYLMARRRDDRGVELVVVDFETGDERPVKWLPDLAEVGRLIIAIDDTLKDRQPLRYQPNTEKIYTVLRKLTGQCRDALADIEAIELEASQQDLQVVLDALADDDDDDRPQASPPIRSPTRRRIPMTLDMMADLMKAELALVAERVDNDDPPDTLDDALTMVYALLDFSEWANAQETGNLASTARQHELIDRLCARMRITVPAVLQLCHEYEVLESNAQTRPVECLSDAWERGARTPADLWVYEAFALTYVCDKYLELEDDDDEQADG